jgi:hypothetical protein
MRKAPRGVTRTCVLNERLAPGDRGIELCGHAEEAVVHRGEACALRKRDAGGGIPEGFDLFLEGLLERRVHPGAAAHGAGFCQGDVFEVDSGRRLGHVWPLFPLRSLVQ